MLVITVKEGSEVFIGWDVYIRLVKSKGRWRLMMQAPREVDISRGENVPPGDPRRDGITPSTIQ